MLKIGTDDRNLPMEGVRVDVPHQEIEEVEEIVAEDAVALVKKVATEKGRLASMLISKIFFTSVCVSV